MRRRQRRSLLYEYPVVILSNIELVKRAKIEIGLGIMLINISVSTEETNLPQVLSISANLATGAFGYRYQQKDGGILFRADITSFYYLRSDISTKKFIVSGGISLGYTF
jgi:hypothetical protein